MGLDNDGTHTKTLSQGTPTLEASGSAEWITLPMTTADEVQHYMPIPWDLDRDRPVRARLHFVHAAAGADSPVFKFGYLFFAKQAQVVEVKGNADKDVSMTAHTCSTTNPSLEVTDWMNLDFEDYIAATDVAVGFCVELDALGGAAADECKLLGVELEYTVDAFDDYRHTTTNEPADTV
jgi:hypothetical protein